MQASKRRGAALVISLITVMLVAGLGAALIQLQSNLDRRHAFSVDRRRALYIAEAGLAEAALAISQGKSGTLASEQQPVLFGGGLYWVESVDLPENKIALVCTARVGTAEFVLRTLVLPNLNPVSSLGFFGTQGVEVGWGTVADGYHSGRGAFATQLDPGAPVDTTGELLLVGSNGDIVLNEGVVGTRADRVEAEEEPGETGGAFDWPGLLEGSGDGEAGGSTGDPGDIWGNPPGGSGDPPPPLSAPPGAPTRLFGRLRPGVDGVVLSNGFSEIDGRIDAFRELPPLPAVTLPSCSEVLSGTVTVAGETTDVGSTVETRIEGDLVLGAGATLTLVGPKVVDVDRLVLESGATLRFDDSTGPIQLYARFGIACAPVSTWESVAHESDARGVTILVDQLAGSQSRVTLPAGGQFHGTLYAPSDAVVVPAGLRWFGSIVCRHLSTEPGARMTYDRRLAIGGDGVPTLPRILSWQIVPVGDGLARSLAVEPLFALQLQGVVPLSPTEAAPETHCEVQYVDTSGLSTTYTGAFAGLDLTDVARIVGVRWVDVRDGTLRGWLRPSGDDPTAAIEVDRGALQEQRSTLTALGGEPRAGLLSDALVVELIASVPLDKLAAEHADVREANERNSPQLDPDKYLDGADNVKWEELFDDVVERDSADEGPSLVPIVPGG
ncbi:MAG: hypothetical protein AAGB93_08355 [Planctomycetota bacterium]